MNLTPRKKKILGALLLAGGGFAWWWFNRGTTAALPASTPGTAAMPVNPASYPQVGATTYRGKNPPAGATNRGRYKPPTGGGTATIYTAGSNWFEFRQGATKNNGLFQITAAKAAAIMKYPKA